MICLDISEYMVHRAQVRMNSILDRLLSNNQIYGTTTR